MTDEASWMEQHFLEAERQLLAKRPSIRTAYPYYSRTVGAAIAWGIELGLYCADEAKRVDLLQRARSLTR